MLNSPYGPAFRATRTRLNSISALVPTWVRRPVALDPDVGDASRDDGPSTMPGIDFQVHADRDPVHLEEAAAEGRSGKTRLGRLGEELAALNQHVCASPLERNNPIERMLRGDENRHQRFHLADVDALGEGYFLSESVERASSGHQVADGVLETRVGNWLGIRGTPRNRTVHGRPPLPEVVS